MELFLHPWYMVAGGALISSPIIIHLINRMRFKRIRWAAMEFLLKSQKRNRRRLIIEQLILLMLRIFLVLLVAFLVARFIGGALGSSGQGTMHVVILDDTPSMGDRWGEQGETRTAMDLAKEQIKQVAKQAALANSAQHMQIFRLSDLQIDPEKARPLFDKRLDNLAEDDIARALDSIKPTMLHVDPVQGIKKGMVIFNAVPQGQKILHLVGDFRETDWAKGSQLEELNAQVGKLLEAGINLSLLDTAHPFRSETKDVLLNHDNLAIVDFRAESRMAAEGVPIEFTVKIQNFGPKDEKNFLHVYIDGVKDFTASVPLDNLPANTVFEQKFTLLFQKKRPTPEFLHVSAEINQEEAGLQVDNVRDMVIEVRKKIPALIIDGAGREGQKPGGDSFHLEVAFLSGRAYEAEYKTLEELEKLNIDAYPSIYFLNVPEIKNKEVLDKLRKYVINGGSIAYFLGDKVSSTFYNKTLHEEYKGLFPVKIAGRYTDALTPEERETRKQRDPQPKILFQNEKHSIVAEGLVPYKTAFRFLLIDRYWPTLPRSQWNPEGEKEAVEEVITLPNRNSIDAYKARAQELAREAFERTEALGAANAEFQKYVEVMRNYRRQVTQALSTELLFSVVSVLDRMLEDPGETKNPARPNMPELWAQPNMKILHDHLKDFRTTLLYGDPLVLVRPYGKGRVAACLTSAGTASKWNEWGGGSPVSWSYPVFIKDLQRYLTSESADLNRIVTRAAGVKLEFDAEKFQDSVEGTFRPQPDLTLKKAEGDADVRPSAEAIKETMAEEKRMLASGEERRVLVFSLQDASRPGVYQFEFKPLDAMQPSEFRAFAFNVDAGAESDLKRAPRDKLERKAKTTDSHVGKVMLFSPGDDVSGFKNREPDASESPWLYLLFIVILVVEQALAVHLSFHLKPGDQATAAPARPQPAAA